MTDDQPDSPDTILLANYAERAYLEYALSVVKGRASMCLIFWKGLSTSASRAVAKHNPNAPRRGQQLAR